MKKIWLLAGLVWAGIVPGAVRAETAAATDVTTSVADLQTQVRELREELNQLNISTEMAAGKAAKIQSPTFGFAGGSFEQDFATASDTWSILQGQTVRLKFLAHPVDDVTGHLDLELWGNVANDVFVYNSMDTLVNENIFMALREFDTTFTSPELSITAFKGLPIGGYYYGRDDFYRLFPDEYDQDKYFRIAGHALPTGIEIKGSDALEGLEVWAGYELQWGNPAEVYAMYQHKLGPSTVGLIDRLTLPQINAYPAGTAYEPAVSITQTANTANPGGSQSNNALELTLKLPLGDWSIDAVGLYKPLPVGITPNYTYVTDVAPGQGTGGTAYLVQQGTLTAADSLGYQVRLGSQNPPLLDSVMLNGEYSGAAAGDLERLSAEMTKIPFTQSLLTFDVTVQKPLIGPNPLIYYGTPGAPLGVAAAPRNQYDPFQVSSNPITGVNNRAMTQFGLSFVYNPGNGWFFRYNPNDFAAYNVNTGLDTPLSLGLAATAFDYTGGTDLFSVVENGQLAWEPTGMLGQATTDGYQSYEQGWLMFRTGALHWILNLEGGFSQSALSYNDSKAPSTKSMQATLSARVDKTTLALGYDTDIWAPEDWDRQFGIVIGRRVLAQLTQTWGDSVFSVKYEKWDNNPNDDPIYQNTSINGVPLPTQEIYTSVTENF